MTGFNLSEWAIGHRSLIAYFILVIVIAGVASYLHLGRSEDPDFTVKTMVVQVAWPGATLGDTIEQITDRIESKLEETPSLDYLKSYTIPGKATIFVNLKDSTLPAQVPDIWYQVRKKLYDIRGTLPQDIVGPGFNDEFGDTYGIVYGFTADGFTPRQLRDYADDVRKKLLELPDIAKIDVLGAQTSASMWSSRRRAWPASASTAARSSRPCRRRTASPRQASFRRMQKKSLSAFRARSSRKKTS